MVFMRTRYTVFLLKYEPVREKTNNLGSDQVRHKPVCTATQAKVEEGLFYLCSENKGADQLRSYCEADLHLCFCLCRLLVFSCEGSYMTLFREK